MRYYWYIGSTARRISEVRKHRKHKVTTVDIKKTLKHTLSFFYVVGESLRGLKFPAHTKSLFQQTSKPKKSSCKNPQICLYYKLLQDKMWICFRHALSTYEFEIPSEFLGGNVVGRDQKFPWYKGCFNPPPSLDTKMFVEHRFDICNSWQIIQQVKCAKFQQAQHKQHPSDLLFQFYQAWHI